MPPSPTRPPPPAPASAFHTRRQTAPRPARGPACFAEPAGAAADGERRASLGDLVTVHYTLRDGDAPPAAPPLDSSRARDAPLTFEVGAGDVFGNPLYAAFDDLVRGLAPGESTSLAAQGEPWSPDKCWKVPADHPEIERLSGRYKSVGGLARGLVVELANGARAVIGDIDDDGVSIDANDMLAGRSRVFELELVSIADGDDGK